MSDIHVCWLFIKLPKSISTYCLTCSTLTNKRYFDYLNIHRDIRTSRYKGKWVLVILYYYTVITRCPLCIYFDIISKSDFLHSTTTCHVNLLATSLILITSVVVENKWLDVIKEVLLLLVILYSYYTTIW